MPFRNVPVCSLRLFCCPSGNFPFFNASIVLLSPLYRVNMMVGSSFASDVLFRSEQARNAFAACTERVPNRLRAGTGFGLFAWLAQALLHACGLRPFPCWVVFAFAAKRRDGKRLLRILQKNVQKVCRLRAECLILSVWAWHSLRWVFPAFPDGHREERLSRPSL